MKKLLLSLTLMMTVAVASAQDARTGATQVAPAQQKDKVEVKKDCCKDAKNSGAEVKACCKDSVAKKCCKAKGECKDAAKKCCKQKAECKDAKKCDKVCDKQKSKK